MTTKLRELAEAYLREACGAEPHETAINLATEHLAAVWPKVFPIPEGSVRVRIVVGYESGPITDGCAYVVCDGMGEEGAVESAFQNGDTHRGILEAWLPPIPAVPTIEATAAGGGA
jgi:hypothetical protein